MLEMCNQDFHLKKPPEILFLRLTDQCNLHCMYCYADSKSSGPIMNMRIMEKVLGEAKDWGVPLVHLDGGEPLLHPKFSSILDLVTRNGFLIGMVTNSTLLDKDIASKLSETNVNQIMTNIDGRKETHDKLRGKSGAYNSVTKALTTLEDYGLLKKTVIATVLTKLNYKEIPYVIESIKGYLVMEYRLITFMPVGRGTTYKENLIMNKKDWLAFTYDILPRIFAEKVNVSLSFAHMLLFQVLKNVGLDTDAMNLVMDKMRLIKGPIGCEGGERVMIISSDGKVSPCPHLPHLCAPGNVSDHSLQYFWNSQVFRNFRRNKHRIPEDCKPCTFVKFCKGGCQAFKYSYGSSLTEKDPRCRLFEEMRREIDNG